MIPDYILKAAREYRDKHGGDQSLEDAFIAGHKATRNPTKKSVTLTSEQETEFNECWAAYREKGCKAKAMLEWQKLSDKEIAIIRSHIEAYVETRDRIYQKDFERYLKDKVFLSVIFKGNQVFYDPKEESNVVMAVPQQKTIDWQS